MYITLKILHRCGLRDHGGQCMIGEEGGEKIKRFAFVSVPTDMGMRLRTALSAITALSKR